MKFTISAGHPYFELTWTNVYQNRDGTWEVRWRDFRAIKQDASFNTEAEARAFAETVCKPPITVEDYGDDLASADQFWREMAERKLTRSQPAHG